MSTAIRLAVFAFDLGASFIEKHLSELAPGATVAVGAYGADKRLAELWPARCPVLLVDKLRSQPVMRLARKAGINTEAWVNRIISRFLSKHGVNVALGEYLDEFLPYAKLLNPI